MASLSSLIRHVVSSDTVLYECRNCGTTLEDPDEQCPECGSTETAAYELLE